MAGAQVAACDYPPAGWPGTTTSGRSSRIGTLFDDDAVIKLLGLAIRDVEDKRVRARAKEKGARVASAAPHGSSRATQTQG